MSSVRPALLFALLTVSVGQAAIVVKNLAPGETLRYPVALLVGTAEHGETIDVANADNTTPDGSNRGPVVDGRFKLLVELKPGVNRLALKAGDDASALVLTYKPMTSPYQVTLVYLTGSEKQTDYPTQLDHDRQDYVAKLRTAARLMQTFTAEVMHDAGLGRVTFRLEEQPDGQPVVRTLAYPEPAATMRARDPGDQWQKTYGFLGKQLDFNHTKALVANAFIAYDAQKKQAVGHTALGGGAQAVFSTNAFCAWPSSLREVQACFDDVTPVDTTKIADDTAFRGTLWSMAATGIGAWLHELGHTFGLPHTTDPRGIMSRGFDWFNRTFVVREPPRKGGKEPVLFRAEQTAIWDPLFSERLVVSPWFQPDGPRLSGKPGPTVAYDWLAHKLTATVPAGVAYAQVEAPRKRFSLPAAQVKGKTQLAIDSAPLREQAASPDGIELVVVDRDGRVVTFDERNARNPAWFVRRWHLSEAATPWAGVPKPPEVDVPALTAQLSARPVASTVLADPNAAVSADFLGHFRANRNVVAYALTTFEAPAERKIKLLGGGDDGLRVWLDGALVLDASGVKVVDVDSASKQVTVAAGSHTLLVESEQAGGGWWFAIRLTGSDGKPLVIGADGNLTTP